MTKEEAKEILENAHFFGRSQDDIDTAIEMAIKALEQDTAPFDFDLYQAGLMDIPKEMIKVLDEIRAEIASIENYGTNNNHDIWFKTPEEIKKDAITIINKYKSGK